ncbi:hypothetical protein PLICRDRAFT_55576 [Plicaturopsis crispa FD-325 SS-3]|nr:hypothetical protein PLICRDRAFT_55576 [Plicaturopsis crispa FD-325 SS-3]
METAQTYGRTLPDQVERIGDLFDAHLTLVSDVRDLYKDRAALEREYAGKLQLLAKKAADKRAKNSAILVVGPEPTKVYDERTLKQSTLDTAYGQIIDSMISTSQDHVNIADALSAQVVETLKGVEKKNDDTKKKQIAFFQKLVSERDRIYSERSKYDEECTEVLAQRQKQGRAQDDKHAERATKQYEQQRVDMYNGKNIYIISTAIANNTKAKFYDEDLPTLEDELQTRLVTRFVKILLHAQALQTSHQDVVKGRLLVVENSLTQVNPSHDQDIFIDHNVRPFSAPPDFTFEPCTSHYDTDEMNIEPAPKVFLQNKLIRCQNKLAELRPVLDAKRRDVEQLSKLVYAYEADHSLGNAEEVMDSFLEAKQQLTSFASSETILNTEIETIIAALGDDVGGNNPHTFKSSSFSIPTQCGYCKSSIWGLSKQGKTCKTCGLSVHSKCELKVPADCTKSRPGRSSTITRSSPAGSTSSSLRSVPTPSSFVKSEVVQPQQEYPSARMLFDFSATSPFELSISEGTAVSVLEEDDGSGWVKVADGRGGKGLVPASYVEFVDEAEPPATLAGNPSREQGSGKYVRAVYTYQAQGADELGLTEGERVELSAGPTGGEHYGDGWWEGINSKGQKGIFPSNYVR